MASQGCEGIKPGWVRVNFNYFIDEQVFSYILDAAALVAEHGWGPMDPPLSLAAIRYVGGKMLAPDAPPGSFRFISAEFEQLRWSWLPESCVEAAAR